MYGDTFHAGTLDSTDDRLAATTPAPGAVMNDVAYQGSSAIPVWTVHKYEIADDAPMSRRIWDDPSTANEDLGMPVPEHKTNRIYPYVNTWEDLHSTSYVVPSDFVGTHVKHLGEQFKGVVEPVGHATVNAISTMVGGPHKKWLH